MDHYDDRFSVVEVVSGDPLDDSNIFDGDELDAISSHISEWLTSLLGKRVGPELIESLGDGTVLCEMYKFFFPKASFKYYKFPFNNEKKKKMNVYYFSQQCLLLGIQACSTIDYSFFVRKQLDKIILCLFRFIVTLISLHYTSKLRLPEYLYSKIQIYTLYYGFVIEEDYQPVNERRSKESLSQSNISRCYIKSNSGRIHKFYHDYYDTLIANPVKKSHHHSWSRLCCSRQRLT